MSKLFKRTLVGIGMVVVVCGAIASRFWRTEVFDCLVLLLSLGCAYEVVKQNALHGKKLFIIPVMVFPLVVFLSNYFAPSVLWALLYEAVALVLIFCGCICAEIVLARAKASKINDETKESGGLLDSSKRTIAYCAYPTMLLGSLYGINGLGLELGLVGLLLVFGVSALSDTFAFFFGVWLKGPRLCPEISPKKGVIGMIFGFVGGIVAAAVIFCVFRFTSILPSEINTIPLVNAILIFVACGIFGSFATQIGDLFESAIKRNLDIKDFGNIFPGHGGFMDRVDGQMFNSVLVLAIMLIFI